MCMWVVLLRTTTTCEGGACTVWCVCVCMFVCVCVCMCACASGLVLQLHVHVCWILLMREGLVPSCVCVCVCVCVCSSGNDCGYLISHQWEELNLLVMHVMVCTCTVGTSTDTYIMEKLPYTLTAAPLYPSKTGSEA